MSGYHKQLFKELTLGDFGEEEMSTAGVVGNVVMGFIPILGQAADVRDTVAAAKQLFDDPNSLAAYAGLGIALIGWVPGGDVLKSLKYGKRLQKRKESLNAQKSQTRFHRRSKNL